MPVVCKYTDGRVIEVDFFESDYCRNICTENAYNIILINNGSLSLQINHQRVQCIAPCIILLKENMDVKFTSSRALSAHCIRFNVSFINKNITFDMVNSGEYDKRMEDFAFIPLNMFYNNEDSFLHTFPLSTEEYQQMAELISKFREAIENQTDYRWSCRSRMYLNVILELLCQVYYDFSSPDTAVIFDKKDPHVWVSLILKKIHTDYSQNISLATIANHFNINKTTVSKKFREITGSSVTEYIIDYRIKCACYSLATTDIKVNEIAYECGFGSTTYFVKQFRSRIGMTPTIYRDNKVAYRKAEYASGAYDKK